MQSMAVPLHVYDVGLEVLSPVAIGAGETEKLSAYTDYLYEGNNVRILDQKKLMQKINEAPELMEEYVRGIRGGMDNNRSNFDLKRYINDTLKCHLDDVTASMVESHVDPGRQEINRCISSNDRAYIPGSSLKGAVRTAVMVDWMANHSGAEKTRHALRSATQESKINFARKALKRINVGRDCLGPISNDQFRYLHVSDFEPEGDIDVVITSRPRFSIKSTAKEIPIPCEAINRGAKLTGEFRIYERHRESAAIDQRKLKHQDYFSFLHDNDLQTLLDIINEMSFKSAARDEAILRGKSKFNVPKVFCSGMMDKIDNAGSMEAYMRIGAGKTWFDNSIGLGFDVEAKENEKLLCELISLAFADRKGRREVRKSFDFPTTRSFTELKERPNEPFGWVKLTFTPRG